MGNRYSSLFFFLKNHRFTLYLLAGLTIGVLLGCLLKERAVELKPLGDLFLNLIFTAVTPLVFFSITSSIASMSNLARFRKIVTLMLTIFVLTGLIAAGFMLLILTQFKPISSFSLNLALSQDISNVNFAQQIVSVFTTDDFFLLLSRKHMLALIIFSGLIGVAAASLGERAQGFVRFLEEGKAVVYRVVHYIMWYAPIGLGGYFAYLVGNYGPKLTGTYGQVVVTYYSVTLFYLAVFFSFYAFLGGGLSGIRCFWKHSITPLLTAFLTGSSNATIPANLKASQAMGIPEDIRETVIPMGATLHMDGSCLAAVLKIMVLFSVFNLPFAGVPTFLMILSVALLCGIVMTGVTEGGFVGETLIITMFGFPPEAMPIMIMIAVLVDPPATAINAGGDILVGLLVKKWIGKEKS